MNAFVITCKRLKRALNFFLYFGFAGGMCFSQGTVMLELLSLAAQLVCNKHL